MTVVVPVYNPGPYLQRTLASLLHQSLSRSRYEVVLVDDGSTDGTAQRLDRAAAEHPDLVRVTHIPNSGSPGRPRNVGTELASYDHVFYCDADDWLPEYSLELLLARARSDNSDLVVSRAIGNRRRVPHPVFEAGDYCTTWRETPEVLTNLTTQKLFRREFLRRRELRFVEGKARLEDFIFMTQAYLQADRISILGTRPCYVLERRDDGGSWTSTVADPEVYFRGVERIIDVVAANTAEGPERDTALFRVLRLELMDPAIGPRLLRGDENQRAEVFAHAGQLLRERIPASAESRLDATSRERAMALRRGDRGAIEHWISWDQAVEADVQLGGASWLRGRLHLDMLVALTRDGEVVRLERSGDRTVLRRPPRPGSTTPGSAGEADVTDEVDNTTVHVSLRSRDIREEWRVRAQVSFQPGARKSDETAMRWSAGATVDFSTVAGGRPLRPGVWDVHVRILSCGFQRDRRVGSVRADGVEEPLPAAVGTLVVSPFWTESGNLSFDVDQWVRPLAAELVRRGVGPATVTRRAMSIPLDLVVADATPHVEVHLLPVGRPGTPPRVLPGALTGSAPARLTVGLRHLRSDEKWSVCLRFGRPGSGPATPLDDVVVRPPGVSEQARRVLGRQVRGKIASVKRRMMTLRKNGAKLLRHQ